MIASSESISRSVTSAHSAGEIPGAVSRLFESSAPMSALIISCTAPQTPALLSIRRLADATPLAVILTDRRKTMLELEVRDFFRRREIPLTPESGLASSLGVHPLIYALTVPAEAVAGIVSDLLQQCFLIGEREPLEFNFVQA